MLANAMKHLGKTPPFHGPKGEILPGSIAEIGYLQLGGHDQLSAADRSAIGRRVSCYRMPSCLPKWSGATTARP